MRSLNSLFFISALWIAAYLLGLTAPVQAAEHHVESRPDNTFFPRDLSITVGDTVTWTNVGGRHNVLASDGSFRCANGCDNQGGDGDPDVNAWSFSLTFNNQGVIDYICELHAGIGMVGSIIVGDTPPDEPGQLKLTAANQQSSEGGGNFTVQVQRFDGSDGAVSVQYSTADGSAQAGSDYQPASGVLNWADGDSTNKAFAVPLIDDLADEPSETLSVMLSNVEGGAILSSPSTATLTINDNDDPTPQPGALAFTEAELQAPETAPAALIEVKRTGGSDGTVTVAYSSQDGSASAGEDYEATSGVLSWDDGETVVKFFEVSLRDDLEEEGPETVNLSLSNPTGGATLGLSSATLTLLDNEQAACVPDPETLCLGDRFQIRVSWENFEGVIGTAKAVDIGRQDSGLFYFFSENNIEMLIKVLDACAINDRFWVSFAATTNVGFEVVVVDTQSGTLKRYENPVGTTAETTLDTDALAVCP